MCNCSSNPANICTQCQSGSPCGCPPDYSIMPQPVSCNVCCPDGYIYSASLNNCVPINATTTSACCPPNTIYQQFTGWCGNTNNRNIFFLGFGPNYPSTYCSVDPIPCNTCSETMSSDCVILPAIPCLGIAAGMTVTQLAQFLCSASFIETLLKNIGLNSSLGNVFCQLVQNCPPVGSGTTPIIGSITITYP